MAIVEELREVGGWARGKSHRYAIVRTLVLRSFEVLRARLCSREKKLSFGQVKVEKTVMHTSRFQVEIWVNKSGVVEMFGLEK